MYGNITPAMWEQIRPFIQDKTVWDLGAGDLQYSHRLVAEGACNVIAVDKELMPAGRSPQIQTLQMLFADIVVPPSGINVAFMSWPQNTRLLGLVRILQQSQIVIYVGCNTNGTACGNEEVFTHLRQRTILSDVRLRANTLLIYGGACTDPRTLHPEEKAALDPQTIHWFD